MDFIEPISLDLSDDIKQHIENIKTVNELSEKLLNNMGISAKYLGDTHIE